MLKLVSATVMAGAAGILANVILGASSLFWRALSVKSRRPIWRHSAHHVYWMLATASASVQASSSCTDTRRASRAGSAIRNACMKNAINNGHCLLPALYTSSVNSV
jgi:hypothetical protein